MRLKDALKNELTLSKLKLVPSSYDIVGGKIAIVMIDDELRLEEGRIVSKIKEIAKVDTVLVKKTVRKGKLRNRGYKIYGKNTEAVHVENGLRFAIDPTKVYFSVREVTERMRATFDIGKETVMVFFAGVGPLAIYAGKKAKKVIGIELNKDAIAYFKRNVMMNKLNNVEVVQGDVHEKAKKWYGKCDRVYMPLPRSAIDFMEDALKCVKRGVIHLYCFASDDELVDVKKTVKSKAKALGKKIRLKKTQTIMQWGPGIQKYRIDIEVK